jgi:hypothetical protein
MAVVPDWVPYSPGMVIVGKLVRVTGKPGQYNQVTNVFDQKSCNIPAGLIGRCELEVPAFAKIVFAKRENNNSSLWGQITNLNAENQRAGVLVGYLHPGRLRAVEVEASKSPRGDGRAGTAMGVRG